MWEVAYWGMKYWGQSQDEGALRKWAEHWGRGWSAAALGGVWLWTSAICEGVSCMFVISEAWPPGSPTRKAEWT